MEDPAFNGNTTGLLLQGATATVSCGSISDNEYAGILVGKAATLKMDGITGSPHDPVTMLGNDITIFCSTANNCYLNLGYNSLKPVQTGLQKSLFGTFLCQPYAINQQAIRNNWNGAVGVPLTSADYSITTCGSALNFVDPSSISPVLCGQAIPHVPGPLLSAMNDPMAFCPSCSLVETEEYGTVPLNVASAAAMTTAENDSLANNENEALVGLNQILMNDIPVPSTAEKYLLNYDYDRLKESYSDGLMKGQLSAADSTSGTDAHLALVEQVQEKRVQDAEGPDYANFRLYTNLERAQANRAAGKLGNALSQLGEIVSTPSSEEADLVSRITCLTQIEKDLRDGVIGWDDVETAMEICNGHGSEKSAAAGQADDGATNDQALPGIRPNPATTEVSVQGYAGQDCTLRILDASGRAVIKELHFNGTATMSVVGIDPGLYMCLIISEQGHTWSGRLVIGR